MRTVNEWLEEYGKSHQNETNKSIHWICVPAIFFSIVGLLYGIKLPLIINTHTVNVAMIAILLITIYYLRLSLPLGLGMFIFGIICLFICHLIEKFVPAPLWLVSVIIFVLAWIGQFYGHHVEGKKPSFLKDLQFLLIGPMWLISFIYKAVGIRY
jgi:uncharacterized membrane protein YGL010W